jgi:hypothetical protein
VAAACITVQFVTREICHAYQLNALLSLLIVGLLAAISWLLAARLMNHIIYFEISRLIILNVGKKDI